MKLKYLSLPLLIHITRKDAVCGRHRHQEKSRRWAGGGGRKEKQYSLVSGRDSWSDWLFGIDCFDSWFLLFFPSNFRTMTDNCWTSNWWVNTSSDLVALTTKVAQMLRQSNKIDYFWYNLWVVDPGIVSLITEINAEARSTEAKSATGQGRHLSISWLPHLSNVTEQLSEKHLKAFGLLLGAGCNRRQPALKAGILSLSVCREEAESGSYWKNRFPEIVI